jgi:hypothetical protein
MTPHNPCGLFELATTPERENQMKIFRLEDRAGDRLLQQYQGYLHNDRGL